MPAGWGDLGRFSARRKRCGSGVWTSRISQISTQPIPNWSPRKAENGSSWYLCGSYDVVYRAPHPRNFLFYLVSPSGFEPETY
jgi:hypothetical protein